MRILAILFILFNFLSQGFAQGVDPFSWNLDTSPKKLAPGGNVPIAVSFTIPPHHHLYQDKVNLELAQGMESFELSPLSFTPSMHMKDPISGKERDIFEGGAVVSAQLTAKASAPGGESRVKFLLSYQGCSESLCYRLMKHEIELPVVVQTAGQNNDSKPFWKDFSLAHQSFWMILLLTFIGGLLSDFTPCVLPIIPITLAFIGLRKAEVRTAHNFFLSLVLVLSMALTYAVLGLVVALLGKNLGFLFQSIYFLSFTALLYVVFALSLFGLFEIQLPLGVRNWLAKLGGQGVVGAILSGFTVGLLAAPCVGPLIASLLLYVAHQQNVFHGFVYLFSYGLGMGSLFLVVGTFYHRLAAKVHGGVYMVWIKYAFAVLLLVPAFYYGSIAYGQLKHQVVKVDAPFWIHDAELGLAQAARENKPIFMDFYATWCLPCLEMEKNTFSNEGFRQFLRERFVPIQVDCTQDTPQCQAMVEKYGVVGWPTFLVLDPQGNLLDSLVGRSLSARELEDILMNRCYPENVAMCSTER